MLRNLFKKTIIIRKCMCQMFFFLLLDVDVSLSYATKVSNTHAANRHDQTHLRHHFLHWFCFCFIFFFTLIKQVLRFVLEQYHPYRQLFSDLLSIVLCLTRWYWSSICILVGLSVLQYVMSGCVCAVMRDLHRPPPRE